MNIEEAYKELFDRYQKLAGYIAVYMFHNKLPELLIQPPSDDWCNKSMMLNVKKSPRDDGKLNIHLSFEQVENQSRGDLND